MVAYLPADPLMETKDENEFRAIWIQPSAEDEWFSYLNPHKQPVFMWRCLCYNQTVHITD